MTESIEWNDGPTGEVPVIPVFDDWVYIPWIMTIRNDGVLILGVFASRADADTVWTEWQQSFPDGVKELKDHGIEELRIGERQWNA